MNKKRKNGYVLFAVILFIMLHFSKTFTTTILADASLIADESKGKYTVIYEPNVGDANNYWDVSVGSESLAVIDKVINSSGKKYQRIITEF